MIKKWDQNMKECDKRNNHISSKLHIIYIYISSNNDRHPVTETFTPTTTFSRGKKRRRIDIFLCMLLQVLEIGKIRKSLKKN